MAKSALTFMAGTMGSLAAMAGATVLATTGVVAVGKQLVLARKVRSLCSGGTTLLPSEACTSCIVDTSLCTLAASAATSSCSTAAAAFTDARRGVVGNAESCREAVCGVPWGEDHAVSNL